VPERQTLQRFKAELFKGLAHPTRIRILELLRAGERAVSDLQGQLGIDASSVSQQLAILRSRNIVQTRKVGTSVFYSVQDAQIFTILDAARQIFTQHLDDLQSMLLEEPQEDDVVLSNSVG
jgi:DNA-binding transcriptional ArsR family regulator